MESFLLFKKNCGTLLGISLLVVSRLAWGQSAPNPIQNLNVITVTVNSASLSWTAPTGTDGNAVASYRLRVSTVPITDQNFDFSTNVAITRSPQSPGTTETFTVNGLTGGVKYYFAIKSANFMGTYSAISNSATATTNFPPHIRVGPTSLEDSLVTGESLLKYITVHNDGLGDLRIALAYDRIATPSLNTQVIVPPGDSLILEITLYAGGLTAGTHTEDFGIFCNDPLTSFITIPVKVHVTNNGFPIARITGSTYDDFGNVYIGSSSVPGWTYITNMGSEPLIISDVSTTDANITIHYLESPQKDTLRISESYYLLYQYKPVAAGPSSGNISIETNDPVNPVLNVGVAGNGVVSPIQLVFDKGIITDTLYSGEIVEQQLTLSNDGYENLEYHIISWLLPSNVKVSPEFGTIPPGEAVILDVIFNATGLDASEYDFQITIENNDPRNYGATLFPATFLVKAPEVVSFSLINPTTGVVLSNSSVSHQLTFDVADPAMAQFTVQANTRPSKSGSVSFSLDGVFANTDNTKAYTINNWLLPVLSAGDHSITAKAFERSNAQGNGGLVSDVIVKMINSAVLTDFDLVNMSGVKLMDIEDGSIIDISQLGSSSVNIIGNTSVSTVKSVKFKLNGTTSRIDNQAPYAMKGTSSADTSWPIKVGDYTLVAYPYVQYYGWGIAGVSKKISFKVVNGSVPTVANARMASQPDETSMMTETEEMKEYLSLYPVPVKDELTLELAKPVEDVVAIRIVNLQGQIVHANTDYTRHFSRYSVSTDKMGLPGGFYVIQLQQSNGKLLTKKFLKE